MADYEANPQELARRTKALEEVAHGVRAVIDEHNEAVERIGDCWGVDELGVQFSSKYVPSSKEFGNYTADLVTGVRTSVDAVVDTATKIQHTEHTNSEHVDAPAKRRP
jgi:hypothetical protein